MSREKFIARQRAYLDEIFALATGEDEARHRFERIAIETFDYLTAAGEFVSIFAVEPDSAYNFVNYRDHARALVPPNLIEQWERWQADYPSLQQRNPCLELYDTMHAIGESHDASSWPYGRERHIQAWVDADNFAAPPPFDDRHGIVTPEFYQRLRKLRQQCGGWLYWNDDIKRIVYAPEPEWQQVRAAHEVRDANRRLEWDGITA